MRQRSCCQRIASWGSPGVRRPGRHVECSIVKQMIYGAHFGVHTGGIVLRFPLHTYELAIADGLRFHTCSACHCPILESAAWYTTGCVLASAHRGAQDDQFG